MNKPCNCEICQRSKRWTKEEDKTKLFDEMCDIIASCEFEEQMAKHEVHKITEYLQEINEVDNYIKWRRS